MKVLLQTSILGNPAKHLATVNSLSFYEFNRTDVYAQIAVVINNEVKVIFDIKDETSKPGLSEITFKFEYSDFQNYTVEYETISESPAIGIFKAKEDNNNESQNYIIVNGEDCVEFTIIDENDIVNINTVEVDVNIIK